MSSGEIVSIPDNGVPYLGYTGDEIREQFVYFKEYADEQRGKLDAAISTLLELVGNFDPQVSEIDVPVPTVDGPPFPIKPNWAPLGLDDGWPDKIPGAPPLMPYPNMDFQYTVPPPPEQISGEWNWAVTPYSSEMWYALFTRVHNSIINGGSGLNDDVYSSIVAREQEARRLNQDRDYQQGMDAVGALGYNLPSGHVATFQRAFQFELMHLDQDALNNLIIKDFDLATENTRFAITTGTELEKLLRSTWESAQKMGLEAQIAAGNYLVSVRDTNIKVYLASWEGIRLDMETLKMQVETITASNEGNLKVWLGQASIYETEINGIVEKNKGLVDARQGEVDVFKAEVQAVAVQYESLVKEAELELKASQLEIEQAIENAKIDLEGYLGQAGLSKEIATSIAGIAAQAIASALGAMNVGMSQGYSSGESRSESWSHGESLGESHSFKE